MIIFRPQRGGLNESIQECRVFDSENSMIEYLVDKFNSTEPKLFGDMTKDNIFISDGFQDPRCGWIDSKAVICTVEGDTHVCGFCTSCYALIPGRIYELDSTNRTLVNRYGIHYEKFVNMDLLCTPKECLFDEPDQLYISADRAGTMVLVCRVPASSYHAVKAFAYNDFINDSFLIPT